MRVALLAISILLLFVSSRDVAEADQFQQTPHLAHVRGYAFEVWATGEKPCDFNKDKLRNDAEFVLNAASIDFGKIGDPNVDPDWPFLTVYAEALKTTVGCVWYVSVSVRASQTGATVFGIPYGAGVDIWESESYGSAPGNGMTAYVSGFVADHLKILVNDMHGARKKYPTQP